MTRMKCKNNWGSTEEFNKREAHILELVNGGKHVRENMRLIRQSENGFGRRTPEQVRNAPQELEEGVAQLDSARDSVSTAGEKLRDVFDYLQAASDALEEAVSTLEAL